MKKQFERFVIEYKALLNERQAKKYKIFLDRNSIIQSFSLYLIMEIIFILFAFIFNKTANPTYLFFTTSMSLIGSLLLYHYRMNLLFHMKYIKPSMIMKLVQLTLVHSIFYIAFVFMFQVELVSIITIIICGIVVFLLTVFVLFVDMNFEYKDQVTITILLQSILFYILFTSMVFLFDIKKPVIVLILYPIFIYILDFIRIILTSYYSKKLVKIVYLSVLIIGFFGLVSELRISRWTYPYVGKLLVFNTYETSKVFYGESSKENTVDIEVSTNYDYINSFIYEKENKGYSTLKTSDYELFDYDIVTNDGYIYMHIYHDEVLINNINSGEVMDESQNESWILVYDEDLQVLNSYYYPQQRLSLEKINGSVYVFLEEAKLDTADYNSDSTFYVYQLEEEKILEHNDIGNQKYILNYDTISDYAYFYQDDTMYAVSRAYPYNGLFVMEPLTSLSNSNRIIGSENGKFIDNTVLKNEFYIRNNDSVFIIENGKEYFFDSALSPYNIVNSALIDDDLVIHIEEESFVTYTIQEFISSNHNGKTDVTLHDYYKMEVIDDFIYIEDNNKISKYDTDLKYVFDVTGYRNDITNQEYFLLDDRILYLDDNNRLHKINLDEIEDPIFDYDGSEICSTNNRFLKDISCINGDFGVIQLSYGILLFILLKRKKSLFEI